MAATKPLSLRPPGVGCAAGRAQPWRSAAVCCDHPTETPSTSLSALSAASLCMEGSTCEKLPSVPQIGHGGQLTGLRWGDIKQAGQGFPWPAAMACCCSARPCRQLRSSRCCRLQFYRGQTPVPLPLLPPRPPLRAWAWPPVPCPKPPVST